MKTAALTGLTTLVGGLFFGPPGLAIVMVLSEQEVLRSVYTVCEHEKLSIETKNNLKGYLFTVVMTLLGGFLFGPNGFVIGGIIGGYTAYKKAYTSKPASEVLPEMSEHEKHLLCQMYSKVFRGYYHRTPYHEKTQKNQKKKDSSFTPKHRSHKKPLLNH
ncbi:Hypothetical predicted protein [Octopus vulgaris]|uniref:Uncharacterized protein n=1 Tax=Octopus vulgaris TaxID=6645 RepID=A0AA36AX45_OCTVU|nr:Hypothetical predicted protein [Octopus vulgaris]